jgi:hypothetical protein
VESAAAGTDVSFRPTTAARIVAGGWLVAVLTVAAQTAAHLTNAFALGRAHPGLDLAVDRNVFDWMSFSAALVAATGLIVLMTLAPARRRSAALLALLVPFLAVDDLTNLHDRLGVPFAGALPSPFDRVDEWSTPVLYLPVLALTFCLLLCHARSTTKPARQVQAALFLLTAAVAVRVFVAILAIREVHPGEASRVIGVAVLEGAELGAWILLAASFLAVAADAARGATARRVPAPTSVDPRGRASGYPQRSV